MRIIALVLLAAGVVFGQTPAKPAAPAAGVSSTKAAGAAATSASPQSAAVKKPASEMPVLHGVVKPMFTERYEDIRIGTGAMAETNKMYHVLYTGYLAATVQKFDSSADHRTPVMKDGKPVMGPDGKPVMGEPQPMVFPQGFGRLIAGFEQGFDGMRIGGKRRIFIPWQLAYGMRDIPTREGHIGIPPKSDLIFDVELVDITDLPAPTAPTAGAGAPRPATPPTPGATAAPSGSGTQAQPATPAAGSTPSVAPAGSAPAAQAPAPAPSQAPSQAPAPAPQTK